MVIYILNHYHPVKFYLLYSISDKIKVYNLPV